MGDATWLAPLAVVTPIAGATVLLTLGRHAGRRPVDALTIAVVLGNVVIAALLVPATRDASSRGATAGRPTSTDWSASSSWPTAPAPASPCW